MKGIELYQFERVEELAYQEGRCGEHIDMWEAPEPVLYEHLPDVYTKKEVEAVLEKFREKGCWFEKNGYQQALDDVQNELEKLGKGERK